ncbi:MAG: amino acid adenylation domain-containing protein [Pseudomonadota bacterium]
MGTSRNSKGSTGAPPARDAAPFARVRAHACAHPDAPAVLTRSGTLRYSDLVDAAERVAGALVSAGVRPGQRVGLYASRSQEAVAAILGISAAGAGYVPLDPTYSAAQIPHMAQDLALDVVLVDGRYTAAAQASLPAACRRIDLGAALSGPTLTQDVAYPGPDAPAYVMYTSGTTGTPKGVVMPVRALGVYPFQRFMAFGPGDVVLHHCTLGADGAVFDIWCPLLNGAALALLEEDVPTVSAVADTMRWHRVTAVGWYAGLHHLVIDHDIEAFETVRFNLSGGDRMSAPHAARLLERWPHIALFNSYGPTEACVGALYHRVTPADAAEGEIAIGRPYDGYGAFLVDGAGQPLAPDPGCEGEIAISGPTVALGYHARPEETARAFVQDPRPGRRGLVYRTGDLARIGPGGAFHLLGRADRQLKIGGRRIELDGLEAALEAEAGVRMAAVWPVPTPSGPLLAGAVLAEPSDEGASVAARARAAVAARLGDAALPAWLHPVNDMPLTPAGKLDRAALAERLSPRLVATPAATASRGVGDAADVLSGIWDHLLGCGPPEHDATFFELGGTSLQMIEAHARIERAFGLRLPIAELMATPRFGALAAHLADRAAAAPASPTRVSTATASPAQAQAPRPDTGPGQRPAPNGAGRDIAIVGMAARLPGIAETGRAALDRYWQTLLDGRTLISTFDPAELEDAGDPPPWHQRGYITARATMIGADFFDADYFGIRPREAEEMDPQARIFLELCRHALDDAGLAGAGSATAVFAASTLNTYLLHNLLHDREALQRFVATYPQGDYARLLGNTAESVATRVAHKLGLTGPAMAVGAACSGSLVAIAQAVACLRSGQADAALAGGVSVTFPQHRSYLAQDGGMASPDGVCRPFDAQANGTVFGDGAGVLVLKRLEDAMRDADPIRAVLRGVGLNNDGADKAAYSAPSVTGQSAAIAAAHRDAGIDPAEIGYVECHGTATALGDPAEIAGLARAFGEGVPGPCWLGAGKGTIGHSDAASGVLGAIKTILSLETGLIPPVAEFEAPNPRIPFADTPFRVAATCTDWPGPRVAGVSSFGVGGTNAHIVLAEAPHAVPEPAASQTARPQILPLSARTPDALAEAAHALAGALADPDAPALERVAATLQRGRKAEPIRRAIAADSVGEARRKLERLRAPKDPLPGPAPRVVFMLPGQGGQYPGMGAGLYSAEPVYREAVDIGAEILAPLLGQDVRALLLPGDTAPDAVAETLRETRLTQPLVFLTEVALARLWQARGVTPDALIGHSVGEIAAAVIAEVMSFEEGLTLIARRGQLMQDRPRGAMLAVLASADRLQPYLVDGVELACMNAPTTQVIAGSTAAIERVEAALAAGSIATSRLQTSHAFHAAAMDPVVDALAEEFAGLRLQAPAIPVVSTVTGTWMTEKEACNPAYWAGQARACVTFARAVSTAYEGSPAVFVEVGPGAALSAFATQVFGRGSHGRVTQSLPDHTQAVSDMSTMASACADLWTAGVPIDWSRAGTDPATRRVSLPGTVFRRRRFWVEPGLAGRARGASPMLRGRERASTRHEAVAEPERGGLEADVAALIATLSGEPAAAIRRDATFLELGYDSLFLSEVAAGLTAAYGVPVSLRSLLTEVQTVSALAAYLERSMTLDAPTGSAAAHPEPRSGAGRDRHASTAEIVGLMQAQIAAVQALMSEQLNTLSRLGASDAGGPTGHAPSPVGLPGAPVSSGTAGFTPIPLSETQREIWMAHQLGEQAATAFNECLILRLSGDLDRAGLEGALADLVARHDALRMRFARSGEGFEVLPVAAPEIRYSDVSEDAAPEQALDSIQRTEAERPIPLSAGPPYRLHLVRVSHDRHVLLFTLHHIACDGRSLGTLITDLAALYTERVGAGDGAHGAALAPAPSFAAHALAAQAAAPRPETLAWWAARLSDAPDLPELPTDAPRPSERSYAGATVQAEIAGDLLQAARRAGAAAGCTLYATLFAALQIVLARLSGAEDIILGVPADARDPATDRMLVGDCISFLPVRAPLDTGAPATAHLRQVGQELAAALDHRDVTLGTLVHALDLPRDLTRRPLTEVLLNLERARPVPPFGPLRADLRAAPKAAVNHDLFFDAAETDAGLRITVHYNATLFEAETILRWVDHLRQVLAALADDPDRNVADLPVLSDAAQAELVDGLNATEARLAYKDVPARVAAQAAAKPDAIAVTDAEGALSYAALDALADAVAAALQARFPEPGARIAVSLPRDRRLPAALIGVMRAGHAYVPLDPEQPLERRREVARTARADAMLSTASTALAADDRPVFDLDAIRPGARPVLPEVDADRPAYVIFTSGSTGVPKGVCIPMGALANLLSSMAMAPGLRAQDRMLALTTVSFDIAALELFGPLTVGAAVHVSSSADLLGGGAVQAALADGAFTVMQATPTLWALLLEVGATLPRGLGALAGGEPLPADLAERLLGSGAEVWNLYGPTETTIWSAAKRIEPGAPVTIGGPIANTELHVLDAERRLLPPGAVGELWIGGRGLALGYFDRADLTEAAFCNVLLGGRIRRLYRTGDLARRLGSGEIAVLGRRDGQVKLRGFRLELGDVESELRACDGVAAAAADVRDAGAGRALGAWLVPRAGQRIDLDAVARRLSERKPDYMVPSVWAVLDALPQTANGKLDRRALPGDALAPLLSPASAGASAPVPESGPDGPAPEDPSAERKGTTAEEPAEDTAPDDGEVRALEDRIAGIWADVLGVEGLDRRATLYQLGADSLSVFRIAARQLAEGLDLEARDVLAHPTVTRLAAFAHAERGRGGAADRPALSDYFGGARRRCAG